MEVPTRLLMDEVVPRMKFGTMAEMAKADIERLGPDASFEDVRRVMAETVNSVDNRMGEVARDNLFWNRYASDLAMFLMRADQYFLGTVREIGGAAADVVRQPLNAARGEPVNLKRLSYVASTLMFQMAYSAMYQKLHTGKWPEEGLDYFYPKNGQFDESGHPQRTGLWSYLKDVYSFVRHPVRTLENKAAPALTMFSELIHNADFWNVEIRHPEDNPAQQAAEVGKYVATQFEPRSVENYQRERKLGASPELLGEQFMGITPANAELNEGPGERMAREIAAGHAGDEPRTPEAAARRELRQSLTRSLRAHKGVPAEVIEAGQQGRLSKEDIREAIRASRETPLQQAFSRLGIDDAARVYSAADAGEKKQLQALLMKKFQAAIKNEAPAQRIETARKVRAAFAGK
ncbi:MAG: hypothetical protein ABSG41_09285 [Bryobacteraceae bacterium]|jgi:hypothetical protein